MSTSPFEPLMRGFLITQGFDPDVKFADSLRQLRSDSDYKTHRDQSLCLVRILDSLTLSGKNITYFHTLSPEMVSYLTAQGLHVEENKSQGRWEISLPEK